jgi:hypothetical protein
MKILEPERLEAIMFYPPDTSVHLELDAARRDRLARELTAARAAGPGVLRRSLARLLVAAGERIAREPCAQPARRLAAR